MGRVRLLFAEIFEDYKRKQFCGGWSGKKLSAWFLDMLYYRHVKFEMCVDTRVDMLSKHLNVPVWSSGKRTWLEINICESSRYM